MAKLKIEFFHDAVCGWCYVQSPRLRKLQQNPNLEIVQKCFVLQKNNDEMIARFGSMEQAKSEILGHWVSCKNAADDPDSINIEGMRAQPFQYPSGYLAALGAKAAELMGGTDVHWDYFDEIQNQHLRLNNNIGDEQVIIETAKIIGLNQQRFAQLLHSDEVIEAVEKDLQRAKKFKIHSIPSLVINDEHVVTSVLSEEDMNQLFLY